MTKPPTTDAEPAVLHETDEWLVVNKPAGWHCVSRDGDASESVQAWRARRDPSANELPESGLCHRLDQGTSGCLLIAKTLAAHERLRTAMGGADGSIHKTYLAVMKGGIDAEGSFRLHFEGRYKRSSKVTVSRAGSWETGGRCRWKVLRRIAARGVDVVEVELVGPGRRHQIRAGFAHLGHPLEGDTLYGAPGPARSSLHAWKLVVDGVTVVAPPPPQFT